MGVRGRGGGEGHPAARGWMLPSRRPPGVVALRPACASAKTQTPDPPCRANETARDDKARGGGGGLRGPDDSARPSGVRGMKTDRLVVVEYFENEVLRFL